MPDLHDFSLAAIRRASELREVPEHQRLAALKALIQETRAGMDPHWIVLGLFGRMKRAAGL